VDDHHLMPLNDIREKIIIEKLTSSSRSRCRNACSTLSPRGGLQGGAAKWAEKDYSERRSTIGWPPEFDLYVDAPTPPQSPADQLLHSSLGGSGSVMFHASGVEAGFRDQGKNGRPSLARESLGRQN